MPEAYEVGITLTLQNGVSAGIQLIQKDLALLDRAIAATSQNLLALQARQGAKPSGSAAEPVSQGLAANETSSGSQKPSDDALDAARHGDNAASSSPQVHPPIQPAVASASALQPRSGRGGGTADDGAGGRSDDRRVPSAASLAPRQSSSVAPLVDDPLTHPAAPRPGALPQVPTTSSALPPNPDVAQSLAASPPRRRAGPVAPRATIPRPAEDVASESVQPRNAPPQRPAAVAPRSAAPVLAADQPSDQSNGRAVAPGPTVAASPTVVKTMAPQARPQTAAPASSRSSSQDESQSTAPDPPYIGRSNGWSDPLDRPSHAPSAASSRSEDPGSRPASAAPSASSSSGMTMQGDIIIDGNKLGRWMTSNLARQASRPPSGPVGPDPRQTPLWSGQAQGF